MMVGRVTGTPEAIVPLVVAGPSGSKAKIDAVLDTGFTDFLTLAPATIAALGLPAMDTIECQLADGHVVSMQSFQAVVEWHGSPREVIVLEADGDALLGMSLVQGSRVAIDVVEDGEVRIEPLA